MDKDAEKYIESGIFNKPTFTEVINCRLVNKVLAENNLDQLTRSKKDCKFETQSSYVKAKTLKLMRSLVMED